MSDSFYQYHVFVCTNSRKEYSACDDFDAQLMCEYMKQEVEKRNLHGEGQIRITQAGCLGRCLSGPVMVVYPQGIWYTYVDRDDVDEIIESHLVNHQPVERLMIDVG